MITSLVPRGVRRLFVPALLAGIALTPTGALADDQAPIVATTVSDANLTIHVRNAIKGAVYVNFNGTVVPGVYASATRTVAATLPTVPAAGTYLLILQKSAANDSDPLGAADVTVGAVGLQGPAGPQGATGPIGPKGDAGVSGPAGQAGPPGPTGATGAPGAQGSKGDTGAAGATGATGAQGSKGDIGATGPVGATGEAGLQGPKGDTGPQGATGVQGSKGDKGEVGPAGAPGLTGPKGDTGAAGQAGATGPAGPSGMQGLQGVAGAQGPKGDQGAAGPQGSKGDTGASGAIGPQGPTGPTGVTGAVGATGPAGAIGPTGAVGPQGPKGDKGDTGLRGAIGADGVDGKTVRSGTGDPANGLGVDGDFYIRLDNNRIFGPKNGSWSSDGVSLIGPKGDVGATGPKGATGADGATGPKGPTGADGAVGAKGDKGADGVSPFALKTSDSSINYLDGAVGIGTSSPKARLHIKDSADAGDSPSNHVVYIENSNDGDSTNGLAIRLNNTKKSSLTNLINGVNDSNNFITFYRNTSLPTNLTPWTSEIAGRIAGVSTLNFDALLTEVRDMMTANAALPTNVWNAFSLDIGVHPHTDILSANWTPVTFSTPTFTLNSSVTTTVTNTLRANFSNLVTGYELWSDPLGAAIAQSQLLIDRGGVTYESGAGDYAEWLERSEAAESIRFGDIVGVRGGRISKNTAGAEQLLVVSFKPIVLGNMPKPGREHASEKVAFMGQVPVKVVGRVHRGDYVVASGKGDGIGRAVPPAALTTDQLNLVVGVAWADSELSILKFVNVAVGLRPTNVIAIVQQQQTQIQALEGKLAGLESKVTALETLEARATQLLAKAESANTSRAQFVAQHAK